MGIYDRDYYREGPGYLESLLPSGLMCRWLIGINVAVFIAQLASASGSDSGGWVTNLFVLSPQQVLSGQVWRLLTYAFLHSPDAWTHIFFNMLFLWWFGSDVEMLYGPWEFLTFYLTAALLGGVAYTAWALVQGDPTPCLGASGAVTALLVLCALHFPHRVIYMFFMVPVPLWLFAIFNVGQDAFMFVGQYKSQVAVVVHLAGALCALVYFRAQLRLVDLLSGWRTRLRQLRHRPRLRLFRPEDLDVPPRREPVTVSALAEDAVPVDEHLEARLDAVLEKLARTGKESLNEKERQILMRASEIYKRRRT